MAASWRIRNTGRRAALRDVAAGLALTAAASGCSSAPPASAPAVARPPARIDGPVDSLIRGGTVYDGSGGRPEPADIALRGDRIVAIGDLGRQRADLEIDATGLAVAPGFINMLSWATVSLLGDGRSISDIRQGVTTEIFGEGTSMGPLTDAMRRRMIAGQSDVKFEVPWSTLAGYLDHLERRGVAPNVASFLGAATIRTCVVGLDDRAATPAELDRMRELVRGEMRAGALGIGSALVYAPGTYANTQELIALCRAAAEYRGLYASHLRFEDARLVEGVDELIRIAREAGLPAEIHHFKAAGRSNWPLLDQAIDRVERARREGLQITANVYLYTASSTGVIVRIPAWAHDGGTARLFERLRDSATRGRLIAEMSRQNFDNIVLVRFRNPALKPLAGQRLVDIARVRGRPPVETLLDLVAEDRSRIDAIFLDVASEDNLRRALQRPWVSICSDGASLSNDDDDVPLHPRSYGNFARFLGRYVREQRVLALPEAIRRMTGLPASNLGLDRRGLLKEGFFADVVVFDPRTIADRATYQEPRQFSVGVQHVLVNGVPVLKDGQHTGALPGRALRGRGATIRGGRSGQGQ